MQRLSTPPSGQPPEKEQEWPGNTEQLLDFSPDPKNPVPENFWCLKDAFEGVQVFGGTGSGKSSGSGQALARAFLEANLGGLVLTAKTDEVLSWKRYAEETNRVPDLLIVNPSSDWRFNFLQYEQERQGAGSGHTENLVNLFCSVIEASDRKQSGGGDAYWMRTLKQLLRNAVDLITLSGMPIDLPSIYQVITTSPSSMAEAADNDWQTNSVCYALIELAEKRIAQHKNDWDFALTKNYWLREFPSLAGDTRSIIVSVFTSMADCFLRGEFRKLFCTDLNFSPEDTFEGRIIILDLPVKEFNELGQFAQVLFKFIWQRSVERRIPADMSREDVERTVRPVFLWADESQFFVNFHDAMFQSTARASRACTVYLTQNLPSYYSVFSGHNAKAETEAFLGNLQTKIFHANGDPATNNWASDSVGKTKQLRFSGNLTESQSAKNASAQNSAGGSQVFDYLIQPQEFTVLRTGGIENETLVDAVVFQGGRRWLPGGKGSKPQNYIRPVFSQNYKSAAHP